MAALRWLGKLDRGWLRVERAAVVAALLVMAVVVSADVVHRKLSDPGWREPARIGVAGLVLFGIVLAALRTRARARSWPATLARAAALTVALGGGALALRALFPGGLIWSQRLALVLMLWVAFLGASIATHEGKHLRMEALDRALSPRARRAVRALALGFSACACAALAWLSLRYCRFLHAEWASTGGVAGAFDELPLPQFAAYAVLPLSLGVMALRFLGQAVRPARGGDGPRSAAGTPPAPGPGGAG